MIKEKKQQTVILIQSELTRNESVLGCMRSCERSDRRILSKIKRFFALRHDTNLNSKSNLLRMTRKRVAFTLAEVLITLGIIGVVAALTIPTLIKNYERKETTAKLKKFNSMLCQAVKMAEYETDSSARSWNEFPFIYQVGNLQQGNVDAISYWNKYLAKQFKVIKVEEGNYDEDYEEHGKDFYSNLPKIYLADGSIIMPSTNGRAYTIYYDVNGDKKPNVGGKDIFTFLVANHRTVDGHEFASNQVCGVGWLPYLNTREKALNRCKQRKMYCTTLLYYDNFEFKKDYPY